MSNNATVGHDAALGDFVTVFPGGNVSGSVQLGAGGTLGANAVVLRGRTVGPGAFIGAGTVATRDVEPGAWRGGRRRAGRSDPSQSAVL